MNTILSHNEKRSLDARTNLSYQFKDWFYKKCKIRSQISHNCRKLYKLINCMVNAKTSFRKSRHFLNISKKIKNSRNMSFFV